MSESAQIALLEKQLEQKTQELEVVKYELSVLKKLIFSSKSERYVTDQLPNQLNLFAAPNEDDQHLEVEEHTITFKRKKKKHPGRAKLPEHLPIEEVVIEPQQDTTGLKKIGQEVSETLKYTKASLVKIRTIRPKYEQANQEGVLIAPLPCRAMHKCIAEPSLIAHIIISKFIDHLPFYRQINRFKRDFEWQLSSSTVNDWFVNCCKLLEPVYDHMVNQIRSSHYLQVDESPIKVLENAKDKQSHQGYQWVYHDPIKHMVVFQYRKGRGQRGPQEFLLEFNGYLQCDGYKVYDKIGKQPGITLVGCVAHARRYFHQALDNDRARAEYALNIFKSIYDTDRNRNQKSDLPWEQRKIHISDQLNNLHLWCKKNIDKVLPKSAIGKAIGYYIRQYPKLEKVVDAKYLKIDNNLIENKIRPLALGRKNYLFAGNHKSAQRIAMMYSFFGTCKAKQKDPTLWLEQTIEKLSDPQFPIEKLIP